MGICFWVLLVLHIRPDKKVLWCKFCVFLSIKMSCRHCNINLTVFQSLLRRKPCYFQGIPYLHGFPNKNFIPLIVTAAEQNFVVGTHRLVWREYCWAQWIFGGIENLLAPFLLHRRLLISAFSLSPDQPRLVHAVGFKSYVSSMISSTLLLLLQDMAQISQIYSINPH